MSFLTLSSGNAATVLKLSFYDAIWIYSNFVFYLLVIVICRSCVFITLLSIPLYFYVSCLNNITLKILAFRFGKSFNTLHINCYFFSNSSLEFLKLNHIIWQVLGTFTTSLSVVKLIHVNRKILNFFHAGKRIDGLI